MKKEDLQKEVLLKENQELRHQIQNLEKILVDVYYGQQLYVIGDNIDSFQTYIHEIQIKIDEVEKSMKSGNSTPTSSH